MSKQQNNTKKGAAAIYIVIFTATLLGIVTLSFVRLMLAESMRTTNYSLSQSAYNSALAGIEDAKVVLLRYQNCVNSGSTFASGVECDDYLDSFDSLNSATNAEDCDLVRNLLGYDTEYNKQNHETLIQTNTSDTVSSAGAAFDQAYTCVKINQKSSNYLTTLTENYPTKIVPIRTGNSDNPNDNDHVNQIDRIVVSWFNRKNVEKVSLDGALDLNNYRYPQYGQNITAANFNSFIAFSDDNANPYYNTFGDPNDSSTRPIAPPTIQMTLIQTAEAFRLSQFYSNSGNATNRGTLTLRPVNKASDSDTITSTHIGNVGGRNALAASANKSQNSPIDVVCDPNSEELEYACVADIVLPRPKEGYAYTRKAKVKVYKRRFTGNHVLYARNTQYDICTHIDANTGRCDGYSTQSDNLNSGVQLSGNAVNLTSNGASYSYSYKICQLFNANGSCGGWSSTKSTTSTSDPTGQNIETIRNLTETRLSGGNYRYTYQYCNTITGTTCTSWSYTRSYTGTAGPQQKFAAISDIRKNFNYTYRVCNAISASSGTCSSWSSSRNYSGAEIKSAARDGIISFQNVKYNNIYSHEYRLCNYNYTDGTCSSWSNLRSGASGYMTTYSGTPSGEGHEYVTETRNVPVAKSDNRNPNTTFIVLNSPYGIPETEVSVQLLHCGSESADISTCRTINFANVQPIIDSTGRANDLFRRVEARIELVDTYFPIANFALAADDDKTDDDNIKKDFYVTNGCTYTESYPTASGVTYSGNKACKDAGDRSAGVAPSMNP